MAAESRSSAMCVRESAHGSKRSLSTNWIGDRKKSGNFEANPSVMCQTPPLAFAEQKIYDLSGNKIEKVCASGATGSPLFEWEVW